MAHKPYNINSKITSALRRIWFYSPARRDILKLAELQGNLCANCGTKVEKLQVDHVINVVPLDEKKRDWNRYIYILFEGEQIAICPECHFQKTKADRETRLKNKRKRKK